MTIGPWDGPSTLMVRQENKNKFELVSFSLKKL